MDKDTTFVALDDSKRTLVVEVLRGGALEPEPREIPNEPKLLRRLRQRLQRERGRCGPVTRQACRGATSTASSRCWAWRVKGVRDGYRRSR
jgi:hypothetical protein